MRFSRPPKKNLISVREWFGTALINPSGQRTALILATIVFLAVLAHVLSRSPMSRRLPHGGEVVATDFTAKNPVECRRPNPNLQKERAKARDSAPAVYHWERTEAAAREKLIRDAFAQLETTLGEASDLEQELAMLKAGESEAVLLQPMIGVSPFYKGKDSDAKAEGSQDDQKAEQSLKQRRERLLSLRVNAWKEFIEGLGFSRLGLDDRECMRLLSDPPLREQVALAVEHQP